MSGEFLIPVPASIEAPNAMPLDVAIDIACEKLGLPLLGGPSGSGWSYYSTVQRCPHLYRRTYMDDATGLRKSVEKVHELRLPAVPLQVGALYHTLQALYYGHGLGPSVYRDRGLRRGDIKPARGRMPTKLIEIPANAADLLLDELKEMAQPLAEDLAASVSGKPLGKRPSGALIAEAERCFDAHTEYYGHGREDLIPLAIEWRAENEPLAYTCRYDAIMRIGPNHPIDSLPPGSTVIYERKTSAYLSEMAKEGWFLDGEILGEILNWKPSGCEELFGPLAALVVDIVTKAKDQKMLQVIVPADLPTVAEHERWIRWTQGEIAMYQGGGVWPKRLTQCFDRWGKCGNWEACRSGDK